MLDVVLLLHSSHFLLEYNAYADNTFKINVINKYIIVRWALDAHRVVQ